MYKECVYENHKLKYYFQPAKESDFDFLTLHEELKAVNKNSGKNLNYGIFGEKANDINFLKDFYSKSLICLIEHESQIIGFFSNYIMPFKQSYLVHQGLVIIFKNVGVNLLHAPYVIANTITREKLGDGYITNISSTPSINTEIAEIFDKVWPAYNSENLIKPPSPAYKEAVQLLTTEYIQNFFPHPETTSVDFKRFTVICATDAAGFENDFYKLSRSSSLLGNLFCHYWINYEKGEDLIQVGLLNEKIVEKNQELLTQVLK